MTLPDIEELYLPYLAAHPPVHILVAAFLGHKPRDRDIARPAPMNELAGIEGMQRGDVHAGLESAAVLDFEELKHRYGH